MAESAGLAAAPLLPASAATGLLPCCLCTNMWMTCAQRRRACAYAVEMLGIPLPGRNHDRAFTWESVSRILCMQRKLELSTCHAAIGNKWAERLSQVYPVVIRRQDREDTEPSDGEPGRFLKGERKRNGGRRIRDTLGAC